MFLRAVFTIAALALFFSFPALAIDVQITQTQTDETFNYTNEQIITREGDLGLVFGDFNFATLDLSNNKLEILQEYTLSEYLQSDSKVLKAVLTPDESLLYIIVEDHPSLVFGFDNQSGQVTYLRQGPRLEESVVFSQKQPIIYSAFLYQGDPNFDIYRYSQTGETLVSLGKRDNRFEEWSIFTPYFIGDEEFLITSTGSPTNEISYTQLFRIQNDKPVFIEEFFPGHYVPHVQFHNSAYFLRDVFINDKIAVLGASSSDFNEIMNENRIFFDISGDTPVQLYETNGSCTYLHENINPQQLFLCNDSETDEDYLLQVDNDDSFNIITDTQAVNEYQTNAENFPFTSVAFGEPVKLLGTTGRSVYLSYYDGEYNISALDEGLTGQNSNQNIRDLREIDNSSKVIRSNNNDYFMYYRGHPGRENWKILSLNKQTESLEFVSTEDQLIDSERNKTGFIANDVIYTLNNYKTEFFKISQDDLIKLSEFNLSNILPAEYFIHNGTDSATMNNNTIIVTTINRLIDNEYAVFSIDVTIDNGTVILSPPTLIAKYNYHWASISTSKNSEQFSLELRDETLLFTRDISTGNWSERTVTVSGSPTKNSSRWWVNTFSNTSTVYDSENDFASQSIIGNDLYVLDEKWLISYSEEDNLHYYQLIDNDWTLYDSVPISSFSDIGGYDNYTVVFAADNYFYLVGEKAHKTTVEVIRWNFTPPTIRQDQVSITVGESSAVDLLANDTFTDNPMDPDSIEILSVPENINVTRVGATITLTSLDNQLGNFELQYRVADTYGNYAEPVAIKVEVKEPVATPSPPASSSSGSGGAIQYGQILLLLLILCLRQGLMQLK